jgi:putative PIN family toxin of toxin-antitoxin system
VIRATLDVNVLASGFPARAGTTAEIIDRWIALAFELVISEHILDGLSRTWRKPYYLPRFTATQVTQTLALLRAEAVVVLPIFTIHGVAEDEEDDLVLATAVAGDVRYLVTGDKYLQSISQYESITILSPRQFLNTLMAGN